MDVFVLQIMSGLRPSVLYYPMTFYEDFGATPLMYFNIANLRICELTNTCTFPCPADDGKCYRPKKPSIVAKLHGSVSI